MLQPLLYVITFLLTMLLSASIYAEVPTSDQIARLDAKKAGLSFQLKKVADANFEVIFNAPDVNSMDTLELSDPTRLVFDFPGVKRNLHSEFTLKDNPLVNSVRVGSHKLVLPRRLCLSGPRLPRLLQSSFIGDSRHRQDLL